MAHYLLRGRDSMVVIRYIHEDNTSTVHVRLNIIELNNEPIQLGCQWRGLKVAIIYERQDFLEGEPKAVKADNGTLQGEVSNESDCYSHLRGRVGIVSSSMGPSDSWRIWIRCACTKVYQFEGHGTIGECGKGIPLIVVNTAAVKTPAKNFRVRTTNTPYLKVVGISP